MKPHTIPYQTITPEIAQKLIESDSPFGQRKSSRRHVHVLRDRILSGEWDPDAGFITVDKAGILTDGLHRCRAIVSAGLPVSVRVVVSDWSAYRDDGRRRTVAERHLVSSGMAAVSRLCGRIINIIDPDIALSVFGSALLASDILNAPHRKPFGCAAALVGGFLASVELPGSGLATLRRISAAEPIGRQEVALCRMAQRGEISTTGEFQRPLALLIYNAATNKKASFPDLRDRLVEISGRK